MSNNPVFIFSKRKYRAIGQLHLTLAAWEASPVHPLYAGMQARRGLEALSESGESGWTLDHLAIFK
jgi:hypothetical protein